MASKHAKNILVTGPPGCGKTTAVRRAASLLTSRGKRVAGLYTAEVRERGERVGFEIVGLGGGRAMLAHVNWEGKARVGRYGVDPGSLDGVLAEELGPRPDGHAKIDAYVVDEIGKMEVLSPRFVEAVGRVLDGPVPVLATVGQKGGGFIAEAKRRPDVAVLEVDARNRDGLPQILADRLLAGA